MTFQSISIVSTVYCYNELRSDATTVWLPVFTLTEGEQLAQTVHSGRKFNISDGLYACDVKNAKLLQNFLTMSKLFDHR